VEQQIMNRWGRRLIVSVVAWSALVAFELAPPGLAARGGQGAIGVNPGLLAGIFYRPLTTFSRGGRVTAVSGVVSDQKVYYLGSAGGVFKTTDAGETWVPVTDGQINVGSIGAIAVAESNPDIVYVGTGTADPRGNVSNGDGMYKSTDAGRTWRHVGLEKAGLIARIRVHPHNPSLVYVAAVGNAFGPNKERGLYRSKDGGATWEQVYAVSESMGANDLTMDPRNPSVMIAAMWTVRRQPWTIDSGSLNDGLVKTIDGGDHWTKLAGGLPSGVMVGKIGVSISGADSSRVYALVEAANDLGGVYRSDDGGATWARVNAHRDLLQRAFYYTHIFADPVDKDLVYATNTGASKSTDGGKTWTQLRPLHGDNHDWWINPQDHQVMIESNDGGASVSLDGGQKWSTEDNQPTEEIYRIAVDTRWPYWVYGAQQDNSSVAVPSTNVGPPNLDAGPGEAGYLAVDPRNPAIVYAGNYGGFLERADGTAGTADNIRVYADVETGQRAADMKYRFQWNAPLRLSPHNPDVIYTTSQYVHRSKDGGLNWERISPDLTRNDKAKQDYAGHGGITFDDTGVEVYDTVFAFEESPVTPGLLWAGSDDGLLHISKDGGKTWEQITPTGLPEWSTINVIDLATKNAGHAIVTAYRHELADTTPLVFETNDYGKTWKRIADGTNGIPAGHPTRVVREDPDLPGFLVAGTEYGMYASYDDGAHWQSLQLNLPRVPIMDLKFYRHNLIVATEGRGFWILDEVPALEGLKNVGASDEAAFFKPSEGYRVGGGRGFGGGAPAVKPPAFYYWFRDEPTAAVTVEVKDASGAVVWTSTAQPGTGTIAQPPSAMALPLEPAGGARGGGGGAGGGGRGGGGRGTFGFAGPAAPAVSAHKGLNVANWTQMTLPALFRVPTGTTMWQGGGPPPRVALGMYTVKVSMGSWSQTQTFHLAGDPRYQPALTDAESAAQLKMAQEVGGWVKTLYDHLAQIRDAKKQAADVAQNTPAVASAAKTLTDQLVDVEGQMTQLKGEAGQDSLNYPGRLDNQLVVLYQNIVGTERKLNQPVTERYADLKPQYDAMAAKWTTALTTDIATFNAAATRAGAATIVIK
jgi:photosystem II stability/assembly factor-like uncharacterized protein